MMADIDEPVGETKSKSRATRRRATAREETGLDTPDPVEIAMKAVATGADRHGAARAVLEKHAALIDIQCKREQEELGNVRVQRITRWLILAAVAALLLGAGAALLSASRSRSLIVEPLSVPPSLAARGLTGQVLSARLLDQLAQFQRETESLRPSDSYANNWEDEIRVDLGSSGVSLGETWRTLKRLLGQETRIAGELTLAPDGRLTITTRAGALSGGSHSGSEAELDALLTRAAVGIYRTTQPYRFAVYAIRNQDPAGSNAALQELAKSRNETERKWALNGLSVNARAAGNFRRSIAYAQQAHAIDPDLWPPIGNLQLSHAALGHDEMSLYFGRRSAELAKRLSTKDYDPIVLRANILNVEADNAAVLGDYAGATGKYQAIQALNLTTFPVKALRARLESAMHEHRRAASTLATIQPNPLMPLPVLTLYRDYVALVKAIDHGERGAAGQHAASLLARSSSLSDQEIFSLPLFAAPVATALAASGRMAEAEAFTARTPADCYQCVRARGLVAIHKGDRQSAERWLREAIRQGPSLPTAYLDLAELRAAQGDRGAALSLVREAHERGPRWAEPLKVWGDLMMREGRFEEAARRYGEAAERAPRWGALHLAWAQALWRSGERDAARAKLRAAGGMDLGAGERARLRQLAAAMGLN